MAQQTINLGTVANDGTGDTLRDGGDKINDNFTELYAGLTGLLDFKGSTDCSANPNYPAASKGDYYLVSVAGKIGGASGIVVSVGDSYFATADNAGGTQASVGTSWTVVEGNLGYAPVNKAGDTMTGDLIVPDEAYDATAWNGSLEVPTKNAVRDKIESLGGASVSDTAYGVGWDGDTTTAPSKNAVYDKIETLTGGTATSWKQAVRVATVAAGTLASSFENGDSVDGVTLATGDRILIKNQAAPAENGIYTVNASGAPTRATDADSAAEVLGAVVAVTEGVTTAKTQWQMTTAAPITLNTTGLVFELSGGANFGTSFPTTPATNRRFYRTDRKLEYVYDGTRWLTTLLFTTAGSLPIAGSYAATTNNQHRTGFPKNGHTDIYVEYIALGYILVGTGNWSVAYNWSASAGSGAAIGSGITVATNVSGTHYYTETAIGSVLAAAADFDFNFTENSGTATFFPMPSISYRLVG